jgi:hypothetical protein
MGPPLTSSSIPPADKKKTTTQLDVFADVSPTIDELNSMSHWRGEIERRKNAMDAIPGSFVDYDEYIIHPHKQTVVSELGRVESYRFSCAGLVVDCYDAAGISLVAVDSQLPETTKEILENCFPGLAFLERLFQQSPQKALSRYGYRGMESLGISGEGPWRVLLPGYVIHAAMGVVNSKKRPEKAYVPDSSVERFYPVPIE